MPNVPKKTRYYAFDGEALRYYIKRNAWTVEQAAKEAGISMVTMYHYINGRREPTISTMDAITVALGVPFTALVTSVNELEARKAGNDEYSFKDC